MDIAALREQPREQERLRDLMALMPKGRHSVLDVGARDGYVSRLLTGSFASVTAVDLEKPGWTIDGVVTLQGDARKLEFPDGAFDVVLIAEVLEHIPEPGLQAACRECLRVARHEVVVGVPYRQDIRIGRTTCRGCGMKNPPWGHVNSFDEQRLSRLFEGADPVATTHVGERRVRTNAFSVLLMDLCGNPWGTYDQGERCIRCGAVLTAPTHRPLWSRPLSRLAVRLNEAQSRLSPPVANWVHMVFRKPGLR